MKVQIDKTPSESKTPSTITVTVDLRFVGWILAFALVAWVVVEILDEVYF
jgi:hypothetical protein